MRSLILTETGVPSSSLGSPSPGVLELDFMSMPDITSLLKT
jgi:hypothetical protein